MDRKKFLIELGTGAMAILGMGGFVGCGIEDNPVDAPREVDFTLDLDDPAYKELKKKGGYIFRSGVIVAHTARDTFAAVSAACTHKGNSIDYRLSEDCFVCLAHGSEFEPGGAVISGPARTPLVKYNTVLLGRSLRVFY